MNKLGKTPSEIFPNFFKKEITDILFYVKKFIIIINNKIKGKNLI